MHNGMVNTGGEKMSKSLGNSLVVADVLTRARPQALRYYLGSVHYRSDLDWTEDGLVEADAAYRRIDNFLERAAEATAADIAPQLPREFADAMNDDLAVPRGLGVLHQTIRDGNRALADGDKDSVADALGAVQAMVDVLGLAPENFGGRDRDDAPLRAAVDALVPAMLTARAAARERKDYAEADRVRDALAAAGVVVEDTPDGPRWRLS
jgi:cysteinyl-tRNA synthetase